MAQAEKSISDNRLEIELAGLTFKNPVFTASGTFGYGLEMASLMDLNMLGAIIVKGLSLKPSCGNPPPRIVETPCGMLNAIGLENIGMDAFVEEALPGLREYNTKIIANIYGHTIDDYEAVARIAARTDGIDAVEINISCPNVKAGGMAFGTDPGMAFRVVRAVRHACDKPLIAKLTPNVTSIADIARSVEKAGADAVSLINTITGMAVDIHERKPCLANVTGGLSGPAIRPIALRMVWEVLQVVSIPVIGIGGIMEAKDALEFLITGASAIQVGTATFRDPSSAIKIIDGICSYMDWHGVKKITDLINTLVI